MKKIEFIFICQIKTLSYGKIIAWIIAALAISNCNYSIRKTSEVAEIPPSSLYSLGELNFSSVYSKVFRTSCVSCHGNSGNVNLESYESAKNNINRIYKAAIEERSMPKAPASPLSLYQLGLLSAWIKQGAPELSPDNPNPNPNPIAPLEPKFESIKSHILEVKCLICHAPGMPVARIPLVTKEDLLNSPLDIVIPGNADESGIILVTTAENPNNLMPPPKDNAGNPTGYSKLSNDEINVIRTWINNGAKD